MAESDTDKPKPHRTFRGGRWQDFEDSRERRKRERQEHGNREPELRSVDDCDPVGYEPPDELKDKPPDVTE